MDTARTWGPDWIPTELKTFLYDLATLSYEGFIKIICPFVVALCISELLSVYVFKDEVILPKEVDFLNAPGDDLSSLLIVKLGREVFLAASFSSRVSVFVNALSILLSQIWAHSLGFGGNVIQLFISGTCNPLTLKQFETVFNTLSLIYLLVFINNYIIKNLLRTLEIRNHP